jgi:biopolymer transport protein ExbD
MNTLAEPQMNATPLIDVLLVLLVMLIFTLPLATHAVRLNLPQRTDAPPLPQVLLHIDFDGRLSWNGVGVSHAEMAARLRAVAAAAHPPTLKVIPDKRTRYDDVAQVLAAAQRAGVSGLAVAPIF